MIIALVGQPNSGKSTSFNAVAGYRAVTANFPGTTLEFTRSAVCSGGQQFEVVDVPWIYSLSGSLPEEGRTVEGLLALEPDAIVHVVDASVLCRSLELTLELLELGRPLVLCLNMMDEAQRKGTTIDIPRLQGQLGIPVVATVASHGEGIAQLFAVALQAARDGSRGWVPPMSRDVETVLAPVVEQVSPARAAAARVPARLLALKLLEGDERFAQRAPGIDAGLVAATNEARRRLEASHGRSADVVVASERHALSLNLFEQVARVTRRTTVSRQDRLDRVVLHRLWGYVVLALVAGGFFYSVFGLGSLLEPPLLRLFDGLGTALTASLPRGSLALTVLTGLLQGFSGGVGIVLPYLVPFLVGLSLLEDAGYIPRAAFLTDALMHRIGLHGKAVIPLVLGYGCSVPAVMSARLMETRRDREVTALLASLVPCAARTTVVFAMVAFFLGPWRALGLYVLNLLVVAGVGRLLLRLRPEDSPGLILEIPPYRKPDFRTVLRKTWFRLREFVVIAWPILIAGSLVLSLIEHLGLSQGVNALLAPLTSGMLGLPPDVGVSLVFGILRKELTIVMLVQALGTSDFPAVLTQTQMLVYTVFTLFYVPCLATLAMLRAVVGLRGMLLAVLLSMGTAVGLATAFRLAGAWLG